MCVILLIGLTSLYLCRYSLVLIIVTLLSTSLDCPLSYASISLVSIHVSLMIDGHGGLENTVLSGLFI